MFIFIYHYYYSQNNYKFVNRKEGWGRIQLFKNDQVSIIYVCQIVSPTQSIVDICPHYRYPSFLRIIFTAKCRHFQGRLRVSNELGEAKPVDIRVITRFGFILPCKKKPQNDTFSIAFTNKKMVNRINPPPPLIKYKGKKHPIKKKVNIQMVLKIISICPRLPQLLHSKSQCAPKRKIEPRDKVLRQYS